MVKLGCKVSELSNGDISKTYFAHCPVHRIVAGHSSSRWSWLIWIDWRAVVVIHSSWPHSVYSHFNSAWSCPSINLFSLNSHCFRYAPSTPCPKRMDYGHANLAFIAIKDWYVYSWKPCGAASLCVCVVLWLGFGSAIGCLSLCSSFAHARFVHCPRALCL